YIFHAILTMTALYMVAGLVEKTTGQTDSRRMGGLYAANAPVSILFLVLVLASAGVPPFLGFWPKLLLLEAGLAQGVTNATPGWVGAAMVIALMVNAVLTLIAGTRLWAHVFWRSGPEGSGSEHGKVDLIPFDGRGRLALGVTSVLVAGIVVAGLWPGPLLDGASTGAADIADPSRYIQATGLAGEAP
ncbi:proton-conducting transporter membrane subunit, partial [uncultured Devosia sp.]|uniref:proton-conducting transporter transmembrane domain-containing protein n=1 Tax=uncultured Devosia sp. TaxID=211434 RepID=UPI002608F711